MLLPRPSVLAPVELCALTALMRRTHMMPHRSTFGLDPDTILPPADTKRWSPSRKAAVVAAARAGLITRQEVCARYMMSDEELVAWERAYDQNGVPGLRTTRLQAYRYGQISGVRNEIEPKAGQELERYR